MKTLKIATLSLIIIMGMLLPAFAAEVSEVAADHKALVASYQEKAAAQDALIQEHQQMKKDYDRRFYVNEKVTPKSGIHGKMDKHCDAIINAAQQEKQVLLDFAKWHQMRAAELEGR